MLALCHNNMPCTCTHSLLSLPRYDKSCGSDMAGSKHNYASEPASQLVPLHVQLLDSLLPHPHTYTLVISLIYDLDL